MVVIENLERATPSQMKALQNKELEILKYLKKICVPQLSNQVQH